MCSRSLVVVGATRGTKDIWLAIQWLLKLSLASGGKSTTINPSAPSKPKNVMDKQEEWQRPITGSATITKTCLHQLQGEARQGKAKHVSSIVGGEGNKKTTDFFYFFCVC